MSDKYFDRAKLSFKPLAQRKNKVRLEEVQVRPGDAPLRLSARAGKAAEEAAVKILGARRENKAVILAFGAHAVKNGLSPVLIGLMERGWVTHLATNGAGIIHDWEFAYQGESSEDVAENLPKGEFGIWEETGFYLNLALTLGAHLGLGYGESVGLLVEQEGLIIPGAAELLEKVQETAETDPPAAAAALDLLYSVKTLSLTAGHIRVPHPWKRFGVQAAAFRLGIPFTGHPMFGHDIIYTHPANCGAAVGRTAERDFLSFVQSVSNLDGGVYLSVGSAVMSPMIFEKALSMARNAAFNQGKNITNHSMYVVDLAESTWDWKGKGEPPMDNPAYYLRYCKTFSRCGGSMTYVQADNRDFLLALHEALARQAAR